MTLPRLIGALIGLSLAGTLPAVAGREIEQARRLSHYRLAITLPTVWRGRIYKRPGGLPVLQVGNFRLPRGDDDVGTKAIKKMRRGSVLIVLLESGGTGGAQFRRLSGPPQVRRNDFLARFEGVPDSHAFARVRFARRRRYFQLWVQFGVRPAPVRLLKEANRVLTTLTVAASSTARG